MTITEAVQDENRVPTIPVDDLINRIQGMANHYFDGMGTHMMCLMYAVEQTDKPKAQELFGRIKKFYTEIPFGQLKDKFEYFPLIFFNARLPELGSLIESMNPENLNSILDSIRELNKIGLQYKANLIYLIKAIRQYPNYAHFTVDVKDPITGKTSQIGIN